MSSTLSWGPIAPAEGRCLGDGIKIALRGAYGGKIPNELGCESIPVLRAISKLTGDKKAEQDAKDLIRAIEENGEIGLKETY